MAFGLLREQLAGPDPQILQLHPPPIPWSLRLKQASHTERKVQGVCVSTRPHVSSPPGSTPPVGVGRMLPPLNPHGHGVTGRPRFALGFRPAWSLFRLAAIRTSGPLHVFSRPRASLGFVLTNILLSGYPRSP